MADKDSHDGTIATNRRARHDYFIDERYEAGVALKGWEVKALRAGRLQLAEGYVMMKNDEAWLHNAHHGNIEHTLSECEPRRGGGVAGHDDELDVVQGEPPADLQHELTHIALRARPVRASRGVPQVHDALAGEGAHDLSGDRKATEAGIEYADRTFSHALEYRRAGRLRHPP